MDKYHRKETKLLVQRDFNSVLIKRKISKEEIAIIYTKTKQIVNAQSVGKNKVRNSYSNPQCVS